MRGGRASGLPVRAQGAHLPAMPPVSTLSRIVLALLVVSALIRIAVHALG
ncbi:hypothetical protein [Teichococcus coralli]|nr:hypothetical protein [Pseudoroseomonas coralli]